MALQLDNAGPLWNASLSQTRLSKEIYWANTVIRKVILLINQFSSFACISTQSLIANLKNAIFFLFAFSSAQKSLQTFADIAVEGFIIIFTHLKAICLRQAFCESARFPSSFTAEFLWFHARFPLYILWIVSRIHLFLLIDFKRRYCLNVQ